MQYEDFYFDSLEYILGPIYNALNLNKRHCYCLQIPIADPSKSVFEVNHNAIRERFWRFGGDGKIKESANYEEFLKINNLSHHD